MKCHTPSSTVSTNKLLNEHFYYSTFDKSCELFKDQFPDIISEWHTKYCFRLTSSHHISAMWFKIPKENTGSGRWVI